MDLVDRLVWLFDGRDGFGPLDAGWSGGRVWLTALL